MKKLILKFLQGYILDKLYLHVIEPLRLKAKKTDNKFDDEMVNEIEQLIINAITK